MQSSDIPSKFAIAFARDAGVGYTEAIPATSPGTPGKASLVTGFPPECWLPTGAGGTPPWGEDFNGLLNQITAWQRFFAGGAFCNPYDPTFQTAVGGYPKGAIVASATTFGTFWYCTAENNTSNPDTGGAGWTLMKWNVGRCVRNTTTASYDGASGASGQAAFGEGIVAGTGAEVEILRTAAIAVGTGFTRRISWQCSGKTISGTILGEAAEFKLERSVDGVTWGTGSVMVAGWAGLSNFAGGTTDASVQSDGGTMYDPLDTAAYYRIAAQAYGDSTITSNHARLTVEELG